MKRLPAASTATPFGVTNPFTESVIFPPVPADWHFHYSIGAAVGDEDIADLNPPPRHLDG